MRGNGSPAAAWLSLTGWTSFAIVGVAASLVAVMLLREVLLALLGDDPLWNLSGTATPTIDAVWIRLGSAAIAVFLTLTALFPLAAMARLAVREPQTSAGRHLLTVWDARRPLASLLLLASIVLVAGTAVIAAAWQLTSIEFAVAVTIAIGYVTLFLLSRLMLTAAITTTAAPASLWQLLRSTRRSRLGGHMHVGGVIVIVAWSVIPALACWLLWAEWERWVHAYASPAAVVCLVVLAGAVLTAQMMGIASVDRREDPRTGFATPLLRPFDPVPTTAFARGGRRASAGLPLLLLTMALPLVSIAIVLAVAWWLWFSLDDYDPQWWRDQLAACSPYREAGLPARYDSRYDSGENRIVEFMQDHRWGGTSFFEPLREEHQHALAKGWYPCHQHAIRFVDEGMNWSPVFLGRDDSAPDDLLVTGAAATSWVDAEAWSVRRSPERIEGFLKMHVDVNRALTRGRPLLAGAGDDGSWASLAAALDDHLDLQRQFGALTLDHLQRLDQLFAWPLQREESPEFGVLVGWLDEWVSNSWIIERSPTGWAHDDPLRCIRKQALAARLFNEARIVCERARSEMALDDAAWQRLDLAEPDRYLPATDGIAGVRLRTLQSPFADIAAAIRHQRGLRAWPLMMRQRLRAEAWQLQHDEWPPDVEVLADLEGFAPTTMHSPWLTPEVANPWPDDVVVSAR